MANKIISYKCPACTGPLHFVGVSGRLECEYCGGKYTTEEIEAIYAAEQAKAEAAAAADGTNECTDEAAPSEQANESTAANDAAETDWEFTSADWGAEADNMRAYNCPSCGAELICDANTAATSCPYCGNPTIIPGRFSGTLRPDLIIPFKLDKAAAITALKQHYRKKKLLPKAFAAQNHIEEIKGVYVPFWLFSGKAVTEVDFNATRVHTRREGQYNVTRTEHFAVHRGGTVEFSRIPVDASSQMPDAHMDSIEPFDYRELVEFSPTYLSGYLADKYDVSQEECASRADTRATNSALDAMRSDVSGFSTCTVAHHNTHLQRGTVNYALMPVWLLNTRWHGKDYLFAMNGQTGRLIGDLPVSKGKWLGWFAGIFASVAVIVSLLLIFVL